MQRARELKAKKDAAEAATLAAALAAPSAAVAAPRSVLGPALEEIEFDDDELSVDGDDDDLPLPDMGW